MSEAIAFDTHQFVKHLTANGFTEQQAEALANEQVNLLNSNLATKTDIAAVKTDIAAVKADIEALRLSTEAKIETQQLETDAKIEAIKADIEALRLSTEAKIEAQQLETKADIEALRLSTEAKIEAIKSDLLKWIFGLVLSLGGLMVGLFALGIKMLGAN